VEKPKLGTKKKLLELQPPNFLVVHSQMFLEKNVVTVFCQHCILQGKMRSMLFASLPFTFGRHSCTTHLAPVSDLGAFIFVLIEDGEIVREILPELIGQLVKLYSSQEFEQQEVSLYCIVGCFPLTRFSRPPLVLQQN